MFENALASVFARSPFSALGEVLMFGRLFIFVCMHLGAIGGLACGVSAVNGMALLIGVALTGWFGISLGYHRLLSHHSFTTMRWLENLLASFGVLSMQGGPIQWVALHHAHHSLAERTGDPYSANRGFWFSHCLWVFERNPNQVSLMKFVRSTSRVMTKNRYLKFLDDHALKMNFALLVLGLAILPLSTFLWAFPLRIVLVWHLTWAINSFAHGAEHKSDIGPRNLRWLAVLTFGEGMHADHHRKPSEYRFGRSSWDLGGGTLSLLSRTRLVRTREQRKGSAS